MPFLSRPSWQLLAGVFAALLFFIAPHHRVAGQALDPVETEGQPLANNVTRLLQAMEVLGTPMAADKVKALQEAIKARDAKKLQQLLDPRVLLVVTLNPEA